MQCDLKRREFIVSLGGAAALWPVPARAQQADHPRRVGVLMAYRETDPDMRHKSSSPGSPRAFRNYAGPRAATCRWTFIGRTIGST